MKKFFAITTTFALAVIIGFACKKSTTTTTPATTTTGSTTSTTSNNTGGATNTATLTTASGSIPCTITSSCGSTSMYGTTNVPTQVGQIGVSFTAAPSAGTYNVVINNPNSTQATVNVGGNYASSGTITVSIVGGKNKIVFNNVVCTSSSYTLTGNITCP